MSKDISEIKTRTAYSWIRGESGTSYLCPKGSLSDEENASEDDLRAICVDESANPHND